MRPPQKNPRRDALKVQFARALRHEATDEERLLWSYLRSKQFAGRRFRRQQPIGPYVVDFYCSAAKLIVELDGSHHWEAEQHAYDEARTLWLAANGYRVLRFSNVEFLRERNSVLDAIWHAVTNIPPSTMSIPPSP